MAKQYRKGKSRVREIGYDWGEWEDFDLEMWLGSGNECISTHVAGYDIIQFRNKPPRTAEEIVAALKRDLAQIRHDGGDDMDLDHLAIVLKGEF